MTGSLLEIKKLTKRYPKVTALDGLSLSVGEGELIGFIGPNGAGKTTTFRIITGMILADDGEVTLYDRTVGSDPLFARRNIGYVPQHVLLYDYLTGLEYLNFIADIRKVEDSGSRMKELLELFELEPHGDRLVREYSGGMRRKLALAGALLPAPPLLLLDESFVGLDPESTYRLIRYLQDNVKQGKTLILSSHILDMMDRFITRVVMLHQGSLVCDMTKEELGADGRLMELYLERSGNGALLE